MSTAHPLLDEIRALLPAGFTVEATAAAHGYRLGRALKSSLTAFDSRSRILEVAGGRWEVFRSAGRPTRSGPLPMRLDRPDAETVPQILELARREGVVPPEPPTR